MNIVFSLLSVFLQISRGEEQIPQNNTLNIYASEFIKVNGTEFSLDGKIWKPVGFNTYLLIEQAAEVPRGTFRSNFSIGTGKKEILAQFKQAKLLNFTCVRTWLYSVNEKYPLLLEDNIYDERIFGALDWIIAAARTHGLKLIFSFTDFWAENGGIASLILLTGKSAEQPSSLQSEFQGKNVFFVCQDCFNLFVKHIQQILLRKNKITGIQYCDENAVLAWELMVIHIYDDNII